MARCERAHVRQNCRGFPIAKAEIRHVEQLGCPVTPGEAERSEQLLFDVFVLGGDWRASNSRPAVGWSSAATT